MLLNLRLRKFQVCRHVETKEIYFFEKAAGEPHHILRDSNGNRISGLWDTIRLSKNLVVIED